MKTTIKEQADALFYNYYAILFDSDSDKGEEILVTKLAKQCAIAACDMIIKEIGYDCLRVNFWQKVKRKIEKL